LQDTYLIGVHFKCLTYWLILVSLRLGTGNPLHLRNCWFSLVIQHQIGLFISFFLLFLHVLQFTCAAVFSYSFVGLALVFGLYKVQENSGFDSVAIFCLMIYCCCTAAFYIWVPRCILIAIFGTTLFILVVSLLLLMRKLTVK
jgi:hypothetical protein